MTGIDYSPDMGGVSVRTWDTRLHLWTKRTFASSFSSATIDVVVSERCLINLLIAEEQEAALAEIHRVEAGRPFGAD